MNSKSNDNSKNVTSYFDKQAGRYQQSSESKMWSILRRRELESCMELLAPQEGESVLDAGCGAGFYTRELLHRGCSVSAIDLSDKMLEQVAAMGVDEAVKGDICTVEFSHQFDKILCAGTLEFCQSPEKAIANLARYLKPEGRLVVLVPKRGFFSGIYFLFHKLHGITVRLFTKKRLIDCAEENGLRLTEVTKPSFSMAVRFDKIGCAKGKYFTQ